MSRVLPLVLIMLTPALVLAQAGDLRLPISLDADSTDYDGKSSMLMFRGLRLSQGTTNIEADVGRASKLDFKDSIWHFVGNVIIDVEAGHIECESAELTFTDTQLRLAQIEGAPATFELRRPGSDEITYAQAGKLQYDLDAGVVEFSDEAIITEGGNQISSQFLVYNIKEQRIKAQSSGEGDEKVKITVIPDSEAAADIANAAGRDVAAIAGEPGPPQESTEEATIPAGESPQEAPVPAGESPQETPVPASESPQETPVPTGESAQEMPQQ